MGSPGPPGTPELLETRAGRVFWALCGRPWPVIVAGVLIIAGSAAFIPRLTKDTSNEAFMPPGHPAVVNRDRVKETFGLADPIVIAVLRDAPGGVFNAGSLQLVAWLTEQVREIPGVDVDRVTSLATEKNITGTADALHIEEFFEDPPRTDAEARRIGEAVMALELYRGKLVARDGSATLIVAELLDPTWAQSAYERMLELVAEAPIRDEQVHIAGEGASNGYIGAYIDSDSRRLIPTTGLLIAGMLWLAYRSQRGVWLPMLAALGSVTVAMGTMAAVGVPFYVITSALAAILIAIAVCDGLHLLGHYYRTVALRPEASRRELVTRTMLSMWVPVAITTLTTVAGFMSMGLTTFMPPVWAFGVFASLGLVAALVFSLGVIPAVLALLAPRPSRALRGAHGAPANDAVTRLMSALGRWIVRRPVLTLMLAGILGGVAVVGAAGLEVNDERIRYFRPSEPIFQADRAINRVFDGTNYLDVMVEADRPDALLEPKNLRRMEALQRFLETLPYVRGSSSIVDRVKLMNQAMNENRAEAYAIPEDERLVAQLFLLYSASSEPDDFGHLVDPEYQRASIRVAMSRGRWTDFEHVMEEARRYLRETFDDGEVRAVLAGRASLAYHWAAELRASHPLGIAWSFALVWLLTSCIFRSALGGMLAIVPVALAVLLIYAVMGHMGIWLSAGTSMTAAIAIGLAIDFSVHALSRIRESSRQGEQLEKAIVAMLGSTGRALFWNFAAILLGFSVLILAKVPSLTHFGLLVATCVTASFLGSVTLLPALIVLTRPAFLRAKEPAAAG